MKLSPSVRTETRRVALGVAGLCAAMLAVFALLGRFDWTVLAGAALGGGYAVLNFFWLGCSVQRAVDCTDPGRAAGLIRLSYGLRLLATGLVGIAGVSLPWFHPVAVIAPLLFPRVTIALMGFRPPRERGAE